MTKNLIELSNQLTQEIDHLVRNFQWFYEHEERIKKEKYEEDQNQTKEKQLKKAETYYDKLHESYQRCCSLFEFIEIVRKTIEPFVTEINNKMSEISSKKEEIGNEMNLMLDVMKEKEKSNKEINEKYEKENYIEWYIETEMYKRKKE